MSMTAASAIQQALLLLGVYDPGEGPSTSEQNDALIVLNNMLDNWSLERANIPVITVATFTLTSATSAYTFGPASNFPTRFIRIQTAGILIPSGAIAGTFIRTPVQLISQPEYAILVDKTAASQAPEKLYYDYQFPVATGQLWPAPGFSGTAMKLEIGGWQALANFPDLVTTVQTPQGYDRGIVMNFAVELSSQYPGVGNLPPNLVQQAAEAKAAFRALNMAPAGNFPASGLINAIPPTGGAAGAAAPPASNPGTP